MINKINSKFIRKTIGLFISISFVGISLYGQINSNQLYAAVDDTYTQSLLHFNSVEGVITFIDETMKVWTPGGNAQISTAQSVFGGSPMLLDGTGDYLYGSGDSGYAFGTGDFTIDFHTRVNSSTYSNGMIIVDFRGTGTNGAYPYIDCINLKLNVYIDNAYRIEGTTTLSLDTWYHIALVRTGTDTKLYINGVQEGSTYVDNNNYVVGVARPLIGANGNNPALHYFGGWIDEFRISKGVARWTGNFTPPTQQYNQPIVQPVLGIDDPYSIVLHHFFGANNSTGFDDENGRLWTTFGSSRVSTDQSMFGGTSMYLDGVGDYLRTPYTSDFDLGSGDFTIESWFNANNFGGYRSIVSRDTYGSNFDWNMGINSSTALSIYTSRTSANLTVTVPTMIPGKWYHYAIVRYNGLITIYLDGVAYGSSGMGISNESQYYVQIGCSSWNNPNGCFGGYLDELRFSKGIARYTTNFTPAAIEFAPASPDPTPTIVPTSIPGTDDSLTGVLLHFNGLNNSTNFIDETGKVWTTYDHSKIHTSQYKFGGASGLFDGNSDYISTPHSEDFNFGNENFTIDFWAYFTYPTRGYEFIASHRSGGGTNGWTFYTESNNTIAFIADADGGGGWDFVLNTGFVPTANTWYHLAAIRNGSDWNLYINGVSLAHIVSAGTPMNMSVPLVIGSDPAYGASYNFEGYLDEFRISKGIARWTADFTPPTLEYLPPAPTAIPTEANHVPTVANVQINSGATDVNLTANTVTQVICSAGITDTDGFQNIQSVTAKLYTGNVAGANDDINNHYTLTGDTQCIPTGGVGNSEDYSCNFNIYYLADPTDSTGDNWVCSITAYDGTDVSAVSSATIEFNTLTALDVTSPLDYGLVNPGANTGSSNSTVTVSNVGNSIIDLNVLGSDMCTDHPTCAGSVLEVENQEYSITPFTFGSGTMLTTLNQFLDVNISKPTANPSNATQVLYWGIDTGWAEQGKLHRPKYYFSSE